MTSTAENVLARCRRLLAEKEAKLVSYAAVKIDLGKDANGQDRGTRDSIRMTRRWEKIDDLIREDLEDYLRAYASVSNAETETAYVTDPWADGEIRSGRWRMLRVYSSPLKTNPQEQGIYQSLAYWPEDYGDFGDYCAESSPLHHEDAKVFVDSPTPATAGHANTAGFIYSANNRIDPETGLWNGEERTDAARAFGTMQATYGTPLENTTRFEKRNDTVPPSPGKGGTGRSYAVDFSINQYGRIDWSKTEVAAVENNGPTVVYGGKYETTRHSEGRNASAVPGGSSSTGYVRGNYSINQYGLYDWSLDVVEPTTDAAEETAEYGSVLETTVHKEGKNAIEPRSPGPGPTGTINRAGFGINQYGLIDWSTETETGKEVVGPAVAYPGKFETTTHTEGRNSSAPQTSTSSNGYVRGNYSINQYGLYDWSLDVVAPTASAPSYLTNYGSALESVSHSEGRNASAPKNPGRGSAGTIKHESFNINQYGFVDWATTEETASELTGPQITHGGVVSTTKHSEGVNSSSVNGIAPGPAGTVVRASYSINRFGRYDWSRDETTAIEKTTEFTETSQFHVLSGKRFVNATTIPPVPNPGLGTPVVNVSVAINEFGLLDGTATCDAAQPPSVFGPFTVENSLSQKVEKTFYFNHSSAPGGATGFLSGGNAITVEYEGVRVNEFGLYDYARIYRIAHVLGSGSVSYTLYTEWTLNIVTTTHYNAVNKNKKTTYHYQGERYRVQHAIAAHSSYAAAASAINAGDYGSSVDSAGNGVWISKRVTKALETTTYAVQERIEPWNPVDGYVEE